MVEFFDQIKEIINQFYYLFLIILGFLIFKLVISTLRDTLDVFDLLIRLSNNLKKLLKILLKILFFPFFILMKICQFIKLCYVRYFVTRRSMFYINVDLNEILI